MPHKDRDARNAYMRQWYANNAAHRNKQRESVEKNKTRYHEECLLLIAKFRENGCLLCEEKEHCCLSAHHVDPATKKTTAGELVRRGCGTPRQLKEELVKCVCLCHNCHSKVHAGILLIPERKQ